MEEKKVHWKTAQKLAKETVDLTDGIEETPIVETEKKVAKQSRPYHVYDARANIVAYAEDEETADAELAKFPGGTKKMI